MPLPIAHCTGLKKARLGLPRFKCRWPAPACCGLPFAVDEAEDGVSKLEAMASTAAGQQGAVMVEVRQVLDWAWLTLTGTARFVEEFFATFGRGRD